MSGSEKLWGGRFKASADADFAAYNDSFRFDRRLFGADLRASAAHCNGLFHAGVLTRLEAEKIKTGLGTILKRAEFDKHYFDEPSEDVHSFIESKLVQLIGDTGRKLHTGRSRNDQVATAFRLWLRECITEISRLALDAQRAFVELAEANRESVLPGYTHLQRAQPVLWAHWCLAYYEMLARDRERIEEVWRRVNVMPLGSAALAGTSYEIDREAVARELGFDGITANSLDGVSDRDFAIEFAGTASIMMMHLSRLAEDLIVYSTAEFGFIELGDAISTGSSLMPQKKNPDALELIRGKSARVFGHHAALLVLMKGLPLAYNKDMQEDKEAVFDVVDALSGTLRVTAIVLRNIFVNRERSAEAAVRGFLNATELADYLVGKGVPFRTAHDTVGGIVLDAIGRGVEIGEMKLSELRKHSEAIDGDVFDALGLGQTLGSKNQIGGTSPERVTEALGAARAAIDREAEEWTRKS
jgi:argininosuccinate lyase